MFSAVIALFKRAPLWKTCLFAGATCSLLTYLFPADYLAARMPKVFHQHFSTQQAAQGGHQNHYVFSDPDRSIQNQVAFAGHMLALPPGNWNPLLTAQDGPNGEVVFLSMMRTQSGMVTGILTAEATTSPASGVPAEFLSPCHDDRMHDRVTLDEQPKKESCAFMNPVTLLPLDTASTSDLIKATLARITALGYPLAPQMIDRGWRMQEMLTVRSNIAAVDFLSIDPKNPQMGPSHDELVQWAQSVRKSFN